MHPSPQLHFATKIYIAYIDEFHLSPFRPFNLGEAVRIHFVALNKGDSKSNAL